MIFITVGTTDFDLLIQTIDDLIESNQLVDNCIAQIGRGTYIPMHMQRFRFTKTLSNFIRSADLIISHAGSGTIFECLREKKQLIVVENPDVRGNHQWELAKVLSDQKYLIRCKHLENILDCIQQAKTIQFNRSSPPKCFISEKILDFLYDKKLLSQFDL